MTVFETSQEWLTQSKLLLQARPTTTQITTKYTYAPPSLRTLHRRKKRLEALAGRRQKSTKKDGEGDTPMGDATEGQQSEAARGVLVLKTKDPVSGTCLSYSTDKAAEVGRLIASLGRLGRGMAGLEIGEVKDEEEKEDEAAKVPSTIAQGTQGQTAQPQQGQQGGGGGGGGGKKKKKGKR